MSALEFTSLKLELCWFSTTAMSVWVRICWLYTLQRGKILFRQKRSPGYDTELQLLVPCSELSTHSLTSLPGPLWPVVLLPVMVPSMGQLDLFEIIRIIKDRVLQNLLKTTTTTKKTQIRTYNERIFLTSIFKIRLNGLICHWNQLIDLICSVRDFPSPFPTLEEW